MAAHLEIDLVSRDRGEDYAAAGRLGAPQARQVADRFHLAKNLTASVEVILARCRTELRRAAQPPALPTTPQADEDQAVALHPQEWPDRSAPMAGKAHLARHEERLECYAQLVELRQAGLTTKDIARRLDMGERTVRYWVKRGIPYGTPELRCKRHRTFDPYAAYVADRWQQGCHNGLQLWREIIAQGFKGGYSSVYRFVESLRGPATPGKGKAERAQTIPEMPLLRWSAKEAVWWFVRPLADLKEAEQSQLALLRQASPTADTTYLLVQEFLVILRRREGHRLETWLDQARTSQIPELRHFATGIERDKEAVVAGLTVPQNTAWWKGL